MDPVLLDSATTGARHCVRLVQVWPLLLWLSPPPAVLGRVLMLVILEMPISGLI